MIKIRIAEDLPYIFDAYLSLDGFLYLDLSEDFELIETKKPIELDIDGRLDFGYIYSAELDVTDINRAIFYTFGVANILDNEFSPIRAFIEMGSTVLHETSLYITQKTSLKYQLTFKIKRLHWAVLFSSLKMSDLVLGDLTFNEGFVLGTNNVQQYLDTDTVGVKFPLVDYGQLRKGYSLNNPTENVFLYNISHARPWFSVLWLLQKAFCQVGYDFSSPLFESPLGRTMITYLINKSWGTEPHRKSLLDVYLRATKDIFVTDTFNLHKFPDFQFQIYFDYKLSDVGGNVETVNVPFPNDPIRYYEYNGTGEVSIKGQIVLKMASSPTTPVRLRAKLIIIHPESSASQLDYIEIDSTETELTEEGELVWDIDSVAYLHTNDKICILVNHPFKIQGNSAIFYPVVLVKESHLLITGIRKYPDNGDVFNIGAELLDPEYLVLDFLKGLTDAFNLKWYEDETNTKVMCTIPYNRVMFGSAIEGFWKPIEYDNLYLKLITDSENITTPDITDTPRYIRKAFKDSTDPYIQNKGYSNSLWSYELDLGAKFSENNKEVYANKFFEPSDNSDLELYRIKMGLDSEHTFDINPRIAIFYGRRVQRIKGLIPKVRSFNYTNTAFQLIPLASQFVDIEISSAANTVGSFITDPTNLIYGINPEKGNSTVSTWFHYVYKQYYQETLNNMNIQYLVNMTKDEFNLIDFRKWYMIKLEGRLVRTRIASIDEYAYLTETPSIINFIPEKQVSNLCDYYQDGGGGLSCANSPLLAWTLTGANCYLFTIVGINADTIILVTVYYRLVGDVAWIKLTNITDFTAELCGQVGDFEAYANVEYDNCPNKNTPIIKLSPCPDVTFTLKCQVVKAFGVTYIGNSIVVNPPSTNYTVISYSSGNGPGPVIVYEPYIEGDLLILPSGIFSIWFKAEVQIGDCAIITVTNSCDENSKAPAVGDCSDVSYDIEAVETTSGCFTINEIISTPIILSDDYDTDIKFRVTNDNGINWTKWQLYNKNSEICAKKIQIRGFMDFCNDSCPRICTMIKEYVTSECDNFSVETKNIAVCNDGEI